MGIPIFLRHFHCISAFFLIFPDQFQLEVIKFFLCHLIFFWDNFFPQHKENFLFWISFFICLREVMPLRKESWETWKKVRELSMESIFGLIYVWMLWIAQCRCWSQNHYCPRKSSNLSQRFQDLSFIPSSRFFLPVVVFFRPSEIS